MTWLTISSEIPGVSGAYTFVLYLQSPLPLSIKKFSGAVLDSGLYLYSGSAYGPGGIKARLSRHLRRKKKVHWHIDHVTSKSNILAAAALPEGRECHTIGKVLKDRQAGIPIPGFGSSDCGTCSSHFLSLPANTDIGGLLASLKTEHIWLAK